ncbi:cell division protein SepF [Candidatus Woesearchaeota archaeon]|nr:cell division protein SepF [Candidatus Woesearchaeota archaeon]
MSGFFSAIKDKILGDSDFDIPEQVDKDFLHVDNNGPGEKAKIVLRPYVLQEFEDVKPILDSLREGYTIPLVNIRGLKDKDLVELKRAINKLKKTTDAIEGDIAGFGEDWIAIVPSFASIHREKKQVETPAQRYERY